jgi:hypothetical protein
MRRFMIAGACVLAGATLSAQGPGDLERQLAERKAMAERQALGERQFVMAERVPLEKSVKGAPFSAETVMESNQALADGNRIARRTTGHVYRDGEGRIRREEDRQNGTVVISIVDGVAGVSYRLEPETRIAWKSSSAAGTAIMKQLEEKRRMEQRQIELERGAARPASPGVPAGEETRARTAPPPPPPPPPPGIGDIRKVGPLERKTMEGIVVEGRKNTSTIPAGQIGNEQAITITSEEWRSPDLNVLVMTHHNDPRMGESSYRLTNIVRGEPDPSLFQVPAGYTIRETEIRRDMQEQR